MILSIYVVGINCLVSFMCLREGFMAKIWCCRRFQDAQVFKINPTRQNVFEEFVLYVPCCSCCNNQVLEILRADIEENILKPVRLNPKNIPDFIKNMDTIWKLRKKSLPKNKISRFILNYNEFGKIKSCSESLSRLNMGRIETDPVINLKTYKRHKQSLEGLNLFNREEGAKA